MTLLFQCSVADCYRASSRGSVKCSWHAVSGLFKSLVLGSLAGWAVLTLLSKL